MTRCLNHRDRSAVDGQTVCESCRMANADRQRAYPVERQTWRRMLERCNNPNHIEYARYGGRGIAVCPEWRHSYEAFVAHVGLRPSAGHSIDRIDVNKGYEPGNVRWATTAEQQRNKRNNRVLSFDGRSQCMVDWTAELGLPPGRLHGRLKSGWSVERALTTPLRHCAKRGSRT